MNVNVIRLNRMSKPVDPRLLHPSIPWCEETATVALSRYRGFASNCFTALFERYPNLRTRMTFLRDPENDDIWSFIDNGEYKFGLQLDPDCRVICCWTSDSFDEIGDWDSDPISSSILWLTKHVPALEGGQNAG